MAVHPYTRLFILSSAPTADEDITEGYEIGDVVHAEGAIYDCLDNAEGAAVWSARGSFSLTVGYVDPTTSLGGEFSGIDTIIFEGASVVESLGEATVTLPVLDGWIPRLEAWTRTGNHTYTVSGDLTAIYRKGTKVRYRDGGSDEYGVVGSSSHAGGTTTVNLIPNSDYSMAAATITDRYISFIENPQGWPGFFNVTIGYTGFSANPTTLVSRWRAIGRVLNYKYVQNALGTSNATTFTITGLPVAIVTNTVLHPTAAYGANNSANLRDSVTGSPLPLRVDINGTTIHLGVDANNLVSWTASGTKGVYALDIEYEY